MSPTEKIVKIIIIYDNLPEIEQTNKSIVPAYSLPNSFVECYPILRSEIARKNSVSSCCPWVPPSLAKRIAKNARSRLIINLSLVVCMCVGKQICHLPDPKSGPDERPEKLNNRSALRLSSSRKWVSGVTGSLVK